MIRAGSRSFYTASLLLPVSVREPAYILYAFCRLSDDAVDEPGARADAVDRLSERLDAIYRGTPEDGPVDRAFADVVARFALPRALPDALLDGLAWDAAGDRVYESYSDVVAYSVRVAGAVGAMMTVLMGVRDASALARAIDLGVAMQLTNIARDVGEDARNGRLYLPRAWMRDAGLDPDQWLARPVFDRRLAEVVRRLLVEADMLYRRSEAGIPALPRLCRPAIRAARLIYAEIGVALERAGLDSVSVRTVVPTSRKLSLLARAATIPAGQNGDLDQPCLAEGRYLVDAMGDAPVATGLDQALPWWDFDAKLGRVIELFDRLERRDRGEFAASGPIPGAIPEPSPANG